MHTKKKVEEISWQIHKPHGTVSNKSALLADGKKKTIEDF